MQSLNWIVTGAAPIGLTDLQKFEEKTNNRIKVVEAYGMTETSPLTISQSCVAENGYKRGATGLLIPNTRAKIVEPNSLMRKGMGPHESGELWIKGPQVCCICFNWALKHSEFFFY